MGSALKDLYDQDFVQKVALAFKKQDASFSSHEFTKVCLSSSWSDLELKQRINCIAESLYLFLPKSYKRTLKALLEVSKSFRGTQGVFLPHYVGLYYQGHINEGLSALEQLTQYSTSEFAVREFLLNDQEHVMKQMLKWSLSSNEHTRRLASEGCRPRLPWAQAISSFKKDPSPVFPILENLKDDESLYVRRSVANNLNDISKDHPDKVLQIAKKWIGCSNRTDWIIKHACRTLLKGGHPKALSLFNYGNNKNLELLSFKLLLKKVFFNQHLCWNARISVKKPMKIRLEYALYFLKKNGDFTRKVFKVSEKTVDSGIIKIEKKHHLKPITTRKYYEGKHFVALIINGIEQEKLAFKLIMNRPSWWVYMIKTKKGKLYTGISTDPDRRFLEHKKDPKKGAKYFRSDRPLKIVFREEFENQSLALRREASIKKMSSLNKRKLASS